MHSFLNDSISSIWHLIALGMSRAVIFVDRYVHVIDKH